MLYRSLVGNPLRENKLNDFLINCPIFTAYYFCLCPVLFSYFDSVSLCESIFTASLAEAIAFC
jgi:hypothetical protein